MSRSTNTPAAVKGDFKISTPTPNCTLPGFWEHSFFFPSLVLEEHSRSAFLYAPNCVSNPYQMDLNCKQKSSITADWRTCRMVFRWCNWKNAPGIGDYRMAETERGRSGERDPDSLRLLVLKFQTAVYERMCVLFKAAETSFHLYRHYRAFTNASPNKQLHQYMLYNSVKINFINRSSYLARRK